MKSFIIRRCLMMATLLFATGALVAQQAELKVEVKPKEAFIFVDGTAYNHHERNLHIVPGQHTIGVYNYGFIGQLQTVNLKAGDNPELNVSLEPVGEIVKGPWGRLRIEDVHNRDAVFSNGKSVEYFIGHVDETNSHLFLTQKMVLPVGTQQISVFDPKLGKEIFSGPVEIVANREALLNAEKGTVRYEEWGKGAEIESLPRFSSTSSETIVAVAPAFSKVTTEPAEIHCGQPAQLTWNAKDAVRGTMKANKVPIADLPLNGNLTVSPKETTTYEYQVVGPGGVFTASQTLRVDPTIQTSLAASPAELTFRKLEDQIKEQGSTTLKWTASYADNVTIEPIGSVNGTSGEQTYTAVPAKTDFGPVDEMKNFKITATNVCGGSDTSTAAVHITGSIDREVVAAALPQTGSPLPLIGLLGLGSLASGFVVRKFRKDR